MDDGVQQPQVLQATGQAVFTIGENSYGRTIQGMISPDAAVRGLEAVRGPGQIVREFDGTPTLVVSPYLVRRIRARELLTQAQIVIGSIVGFTALGLATEVNWVHGAVGAGLGVVASVPLLHLFARSK
jgi:hypothetical protein